MAFLGMAYGLGNIMIGKVLKTAAETAVKISLPAVLAFGALLCGCSFNNPAAAVEGAVRYYTKEVVLNTWVDDEKTWWDEVETRLYNEQGSLSVVLKNNYEQMTETGHEDYMIVQTDVYEIDSNGEQQLSEYYRYEYHPDYYEYIDDEGNETIDVCYRISRGETYSADEVLRYYYTVDYTTEAVVPDGNYETPDYDYYASIIDVRTVDDENTAEQHATYAEDPDGQKHIRTEKFFIRNADDTGLELAKEFACWYDAASPYRHTYNLYHSFRGEEAEDEFYYFTRFSYDDSGNIHQQTDFEYTADTVPTVTPGDHFDGTFEDDQALGWPLATMNYEAEFNKIGEQQAMLRKDYDAAGNIVLEEQWYKGELIEYSEYSYNGASVLTDMKRYTNGGNLLNDRKTIRFSDRILSVAGYSKDDEESEQEYTIKEICEYKYYDYSASESQSDSRSGVPLLMIRPSDSWTGLSEQQIRGSF